jgi:hypothetical protein
MSSAQLAERLEHTWKMHRRAEAEALPLELWGSFRGPVRQRSAYPFISWLGARVGFFLLSFGPSFFYSIEGLFSEKHRALMRVHLSLCEARDIIDEIKRRAIRS